MVAALQLACPDPPGGTELRDLLEEVVVNVKEERHPRHEVVDVEPGGNAPLHVLEAVDERERELLYRRRARFADVVARHRDRVPLGHLARPEAERVDDEVHRRPLGHDPFALRDVLLETVVLDRAAECGERIAAFLRGSEVHRPHDRRGSVDRHRRRDLVDGDLVEQDLHVADRVDRDALATDLATRKRIVGIAAHERRHVEGGREPGHAVREQVVEALVGVLGRAEARELAHRPEARPIHRGMDAARVRERPWCGELRGRVESLEVVRRVKRLDRDLGERGESLLPLGALLHGRPVSLIEPTLLCGFALLERHAATRERAMTMRCTSLVPS